MQYKIFTLFILSFFTISKVSSQDIEDVSTIDRSKLLVNGITISKSIVDSIQTQTNKKFEPLKFYHWKDSIIDTTNYGHWDSTIHGIYVKRINEGFAREIFDQFYAPVVREGNYIYLTHLDFDSSLKETYYDIAIVRAENQFEVLKRVETQAPNYDISNQKIIDKLKEWDKEVNFKMVVADEDRFEALMLNKPKDLKKFAQEVYEFCPDVIDQGYGSMKDMLKDYKENNYFWLWWD
mgnify:CR=1 FL=1